MLFILRAWKKLWIPVQDHQSCISGWSRHFSCCPLSTVSCFWYFVQWGPYSSRMYPWTTAKQKGQRWMNFSKYTNYLPTSPMKIQIPVLQECQKWWRMCSKWWRCFRLAGARRAEFVQRALAQVPCWWPCNGMEINIEIELFFNLISIIFIYKIQRLPKRS